MLRKSRLAAFVALIGLAGCAEFDGFYDDDSDLVQRHGNWSERPAISDRPDADRTGAYGGPDIRR